MTHRAAIYTVRVRRKFQRGDPEYLRLGNIDGDGTSLASLISEIGNGLMEQTDEGLTRIRCTECTSTRSEVFMMLTHGQSGVAADIVDEDNRPAFHQEPEHTHEIKLGALFELPPAQTTGWLAVHIQAGRGVKGLLEKGLLRAFRNREDDFVLVINPAVSANALIQAAQANRIEKVKLVKLVRPNDAARAITDKWVHAGNLGQLELDVTGLTAVQDEQGELRPRQLRERLRPDLLIRYLRGQRVALNDMVEVMGIRFDTVKFEVVLPNGARRTYNIEHPGTGHPISEDLDVDLRDGVPTDASLRRALRDAIAHAQGEM